MDIYLDRFSPVRKLGEGGFAEVWLAEDKDRRDSVACKILSTEDPAARLRFHREYLVLSKLSHPGIVQVYDFLKNGRNLYSMEFVEGSTIREYLDGLENPDPNLTTAYHRYPEGLKAALEILIQLTETLVYLHNQSIIHRDLKPENILYSRKENHIKILDFGLVRATEFDEFTTQTGIIQGTPSYISPEQIQGREVDLRADLYSLGIIMFELLTGQLPFKGATVMMLLDMHLRNSPPPPTSFNSLIPISLENTILKLLSKEPQRRHSTAAEVVRELVVSRQSIGVSDSVEPTTIELPTIALKVEAPDNLLIAPWIGHGTILNSLKKAVTDYVGGQAAFHLISGDHGSGKSRLMEEVQAEGINRHMEVVLSAAPEETNLPYQLFQSVMNHIARKHEEFMGPEKAILASSFPGIGSAQSEDSEGRTIANLDPRGEKARLFHAVYTVLNRLAENEKIILLLDDLQWADESSLELLNHLAYSFTGQDAGAPLLMIGAIIEEEAETHPDAANWMKQKTCRDAVRHHLNPMTPVEVASFAQALLGHPEPPPARFLATLLELTGGNPFLITETLHTMISDEQLKRKTGRLTWDFSGFVTADRATIILQQMPLPKNIQDALERRMKNLSEEENLALQSAALIGRKFSFLLWDKISELSEDQLLDLAERLLKLRILHERPNEILEFANEQTRKILMDSLSGLRKRRLHCRIADAILELYPKVPEDQEIPLATNLDACGRQEEALNYYLPAAERASRHYHTQLADFLWRTISEITEEMDSMKELCARSHGELGKLAIFTSRYSEADTYFEHAIQLLPQGDPGRQYWRIRKAQCQGQTGNIQGMEDQLTVLLPEIIDGGNALNAAWGKYFLGVALWQKGDWESSIGQLRESLAGFQSIQNVEGILSVYDNLGIPYFYLGRDSEAEATFSQALSEAEQYGDVRRQLITMSNLIAFYNNHGELEKSKALFEKALKLSESIGDWRHYAFTTFSGATLEYYLSNMNRAVALANKASELATEIGSREIVAHCLFLKGEIAMDLGNLDEARALIEESRTIYAEAGIERVSASISAAIGYIKVVKDGDPSGMGEIESSIQTLREMQNYSDLCYALIHLANARAHRGETDHPRSILGEVIQIAEEHHYRHIADRARKHQEKME